MTPAPNWIFASNNAGKFAEIQTLLKDIGLTVRPQSDYGVLPAAETATTFVENALIKARHAASLTGLPSIADDSGLSVDALNGAPGIHSARFAGPGCSDADNIERLLARLDEVPEDRRTARFYCVLVAMLSPDDPAPMIAQGEWIGSIALEPTGSSGFGYDPVFFDPDVGATAAELPLKLKNSVSHRYRALQYLQRKLVNQS